MPSAPSQLGGPVPSGVIVPLCTPLTPDRELDLSSLERLCGLCLEAGVAGLFVGGSTGETAYLTDAQRCAVLEAVVGYAAGQVPVFAGVIDMTTARVVEQARAADKLGADGLVATAPFYAPTHPAEIAVHFRTIRGAVDLPLLAYDIPRAVHTKLPAELVAELAEERVLAGLKDSSGDIDGFRSVDRARRGRLVPGVHRVGGQRRPRAVRRRTRHRAGPGQRRPARLRPAVHRGHGRRLGRGRRRAGAAAPTVRAHRGRRTAAGWGCTRPRSVRSRRPSSGAACSAAATTSLPMIPLDEAEIAAVHAFLTDAGLT